MSDDPVQADSYGHSRVDRSVDDSRQYPDSRETEVRTDPTSSQIIPDEQSMQSVARSEESTSTNCGLQIQEEEKVTEESLRVVENISGQPEQLAYSQHPCIHPILRFD